MHATRTLLKSAPELWEELSDASALGRHLGAFGEIRITRLEPGSMVVWEGDRAKGEVLIEPTGLGTRVTLTADEDVEYATGEKPEDDQVPRAFVAAPPPAPTGLIGRIRGWLLGPPRSFVLVPEEPDLEPERDPPGPEDVVEWRFPAGPDEALAVLTGVLDALGAAHHRPFSRA